MAYSYFSQKKPKEYFKLNGNLVYVFFRKHPVASKVHFSIHRTASNVQYQSGNVNFGKNFFVIILLLGRIDITAEMK